MTTRTAAAALVLATLMGCSQGLEPNLDHPKPDGNNPDNSPRKSFIITLAPKNNAARVAADYGIEPQFVYSHVMTGFAGSISEAARSGLLKDARVVRVDPDEAIEITGGDTQPTPPWGLDRIDQRTPALDGLYTYQSTGKGVTAYIVDTGLRYTHEDFSGRASFGFDAFGGNGSDCQGHGTHVAGTVGGTRYGVAKEVSLVSVRVLDCSGGGTTASVIAGLDWIVANATRPAVANLSLSGGGNTALDDAIRRVVAAGVTVAVSAGNKSMTACYFSPARVAEVITVGATDDTDAPASFTNYGSCVDLYAPGVSIVSAGAGSDNASAIKSGTSMSAPHTAGVAALVLEGSPSASPQLVSATLADWSTKRIVRFSGSDRGDVLYAAGTVSWDPGNLSPTARFSYQCTGLACTFTDQSSDSDGNIAAWEWTFGDQGSSSVASPVHTYDSAGTYRVTLVVRDNGGAVGMVAQDISVADGPAVNVPPNANFSASCVRLACEFLDASADPDGAISQWEWIIGEGASGVQTAATNPSHSFTAGGVYRITLTVTDNLGARGTTTKDLPVGVVLTASGHRVKGKPALDLTWKGAETPMVAIFLNGALLSTVTNSGKYSYQASKSGQASFTVRVCEAGISNPVCSLEQKITI
jgi:subtilisin family serine protease